MRVDRPGIRASARFETRIAFPHIGGRLFGALASDEQLLLIANLALCFVVFFFGYLLLGALRAVALLRWQVAQLD
jgi:hypothetical protein